MFVTKSATRRDYLRVHLNFCTSYTTTSETWFNIVLKKKRSLWPKQAGLNRRDGKRRYPRQVYRVGRRSRYLLVTAPVGRARSHIRSTFVTHTPGRDPARPCPGRLPNCASTREPAGITCARAMSRLPLTYLPNLSTYFSFANKYSVARQRLLLVRQTIETDSRNYQSRIAMLTLI